MGFVAMLAVQIPTMAQETAQEMQIEESIENEVQTQGEQFEIQVQEPKEESQGQSEVDEQLTTQETQIEEVETTESQMQETEVESEEQTQEAESESQIQQETEASTEKVTDSVDTEENEESTLETTVNSGEQENGWLCGNDGNYLYVRDGNTLKQCVAEINGSYYGFDDNGIMYVDKEFIIWDDEINEYGYYRAKSNGKLYVSEWYENEWGDRYYYGEEGRSYSGVHEVNGNLCCFYSNDQLCKNTYFTTENGENYYCDSDGNATKLTNNSWTKVDGKYFYVKNGKVLANCVEKIGNAYYGFDYAGQMYADESFYFSTWDNNTYTYNYYRAKKNGSLYISQWYYDGNYYYYYGTDGVAYNGVKDINGVKYYFENSQMATSGFCESEGNVYIINEDGHLTACTANGWVLYQNQYYYLENASPIKNCVRKIENSYYGFDNEGVMYKDCTFTIGWNWRVCYRARSNGKLYVSEWYKDTDGNWYFYDDNACGASGLKIINGKKYLFSSYNEYAHKLLINSIEYWDGSYYAVDKNGEILQSEGWHKIVGDWCYVKEDGTLYQGILENCGYTYYMDPKMWKNIEITDIDGNACKIDSSGHISKITENGFFNRGWRSSYVSEGTIVKNCWKRISGKWYYFDKDGYMMISDDRNNGTVHTIKINNKYYYFYEDGAMAENGWVYMCTGKWCFAKASGELVTGDAWIGKTLYHFSDDGVLKSGICNENGTYAVFNKDGAKLGTITQEGWNKINGNYYYLEDGCVKADGAYKLANGKWYVFDKDGKMLSGTKQNNRWLSESGSALTGWIKRGGAWYYADLDTAELYTGFQKINGVQYYFRSNGTMLAEETVVDSKLIMAESNGAVKGIVLLEDGWSYHDGECYYSKKGVVYTGWVGKYYVERGRMQRNTSIYDSKAKKYYWVDEYGVYQKNKWVNNDQCYAKSDGTLAENEWIEIDGKTYYFEYRYYGPGQKVCGLRQIGKTYLVFDADGVYLADMSNMPNGWLFINGNYYYNENGKPKWACDALIGGKTYKFSYLGTLLTDWFGVRIAYDVTDLADRCSYYQKNGALASYVGWKMINGKWYYFDSRSKCLEGWATLNGKKYYFKTFTDTHYANHSNGEPGEMCTGYQIIDGVLYYFNSNGACQGVCGPQNGWYRADGDWYYMKGGKVITRSIGYMEYVLEQSTIIVSIGGTEYVFDNNTGKMITNKIVDCDGKRYVDASGKIVTQKGWRLTSNGYIYIQTDGTVCIGVHKINGSVYYFDADGILLN